jgi:hypothetical protein
MPAASRCEPWVWRGECILAPAERQDPAVAHP